MKKRISFRQRLSNGSPCPVCEIGRLAETVGVQRCNLCGHRAWNSFFIIPFSAVLDGDRFVVVGDEEGTVWVKGRQLAPQQTAVMKGGRLTTTIEMVADPLTINTNCYQLHNPHRLGDYRPETHVIKVSDLYQGDRFSFN